MVRYSDLIHRVISSRFLPWLLLAAGVLASIWLSWPLLIDAHDADDVPHGIRVLLVGSSMALLLSLAVRALRNQVEDSRQAMELAQFYHRCSDDNMRAIFDSSVDGIILINSVGVVQMLNAATERLFGYRAAEVVGNNVSMLMPAPHREQHDHYLQQYLSSGQAKVIGVGREVEGQRKDGSLFPMRLAVSEIKMEGQLPRFVGIVHDITKQKEAEKVLHLHTVELKSLIGERTAELQAAKELAESANRTKSAFFASMSHELRTPLHAVLNFANMGAEKAFSVTPEKLEQYFIKIQSAGRRMLDMVNDVLDFSRLEAGKMQFDFRKNDLLEIAREIVSELQELAARKSLTLTIAPVDVPTILLCDGVRIGQVLRNLLANAIRFSPPSGTVTVHLGNMELQGRRAGDAPIPSLRVCVADTGPGIPDSDLEIIFDEFVQSNHPYSTGGSGLGLAICRRILEAHHGRIWAENRPEGGACVRFALPYHPSVVSGVIKEAAPATQRAL